MELMICCSMSVRMGIFDASVRKMRAPIVKMDTMTLMVNILTGFVNQIVKIFFLSRHFIFGGCRRFESSSFRVHSVFSIDYASTPPPPSPCNDTDSNFLYLFQSII